jgi:7-cyano-7-deazaguanine synthase
MSGGVDSAVLTSLLLQDGSEVYPVYVRAGMKWEEVESIWLHRFLAAIDSAALQPLREMRVPVDDVYGSHWSLGGSGRPSFDAPADADYLPGRNILLVSLAALYCAHNGIDRIASGVLAANPFPDATDEFFQAMAASLSMDLRRPIRIERPFRQLRKEDVVLLGAQLPLELTFTCNNPVGELHCGDCNKCAERQGGFVRAGVPDPTVYARSPSTRV